MRIELQSEHQQVQVHALWFKVLPIQLEIPSLLILMEAGLREAA